jgi:hypothetical protein
LFFSSASGRDATPQADTTENFHFIQITVPRPKLDF